MTQASPHAILALHIARGLIQTFEPHSLHHHLLTKHPGLLSDAAAACRIKTVGILPHGHGTRNETRPFLHHLETGVVEITDEAAATFRSPVLQAQAPQVQPLRQTLAAPSAIALIISLPSLPPLPPRLSAAGIPLLSDPNVLRHILQVMDHNSVHLPLLLDTRM